MIVKGCGKWESLGGECVKFGLMIFEIINMVWYLKDEGMVYCLKLFYFYIGSQFIDICFVKEVIFEGVCIYVELYKMGFLLDFVDVGGGLGIDYDGMVFISELLCNYIMQEYVLDVVYGMKEVCDFEGVLYFNLVSESGCVIIVYYSCVIIQIVGEICFNSLEVDISENEGEYIFVSNMCEMVESFDQ